MIRCFEYPFSRFFLQGNILPINISHELFGIIFRKNGTIHLGGSKHFLQGERRISETACKGEFKLYLYLYS